MFGIDYFSASGTVLKQVQKFTAFFLSRTGEHLYVRDAKGDHEALVYSLATPAYTNAINKFNKIDVYVNAVSCIGVRLTASAY